MGSFPWFESSELIVMKLKFQQPKKKGSVSSLMLAAALAWNVNQNCYELWFLGKWQETEKNMCFFSMFPHVILQVVFAPHRIEELDLMFNPWLLQVWVPVLHGHRHEGIKTR